MSMSIFSVHFCRRKVDMLQPCNFRGADGSKMLCQMPVVSLPDDLSQQLNNSETGTIDDTGGPGVAIYRASDERAHADIYFGLVLDGFRLYENISSGHPEINMQFAVAPNISCPSEVVDFNPDNNDFIAIQVGIGLFVSRWSL